MNRIKVYLRKYKADLIISAIVIIISIVILLIPKKSGDYAVVYIDGVQTEKYNLSTDTEVDIVSSNGGHNVMKISGGECYLTDSNCPDKICVHQGKISQNGQSIICLPHKLVITIESNNKAEVDTISR